MFADTFIMETTITIAEKLGLRSEEFEMIKDILGRVPNFTELSAYSVMWSEHCSYKNSIKWLKTLPREGSKLLVKAGEENAGLVDIGDGYGVVFKIESHNHPSAIEPFRSRNRCGRNTSRYFYNGCKAGGGIKFFTIR